MLLKNAIFILTVLALYLIQAGLFSADVNIFSAINLIVVFTIWLSYIDSRWSVGLAIAGGILLDLQQSLGGVNVLAIFLLISFICFLKKKFVSADRLVYFMAVAMFSLIFWIGSQSLLVRIFNGLFDNWSLGSGWGWGSLFNLNDFGYFITINFVLLVIIYIAFHRKFSLSLRYEKKS